jgi:putative NIF3 family GTP cyclohydrolase 1 type 2
MENDPRGVDEARADIEAAKKSFEGLKDAEKEFFDLDRLSSPYGDSRILHGEDDVEVAGVLVGIDIGEGELVLADRLKEKGHRIDAVISHHPSAHALAALAGVMRIQPGIYATAGVPIGQAQGVLEPRIKDVESRLQPVNHQRAADAARLLELPLMCLHTVADNCVATFLTELFEEKQPRTLGDLMELFDEVPEFRIAKAQGNGHVIVAGSKESRAGKIMVEMTGGTEGAKEMYRKLARAGVSTIVGMHLSKEHVDAAKAENLNIVLAGHIASDNVGINLLLDAILDEGVEVISTSGFRRVER